MEASRLQRGTWLSHYLLAPNFHHQALTLEPRPFGHWSQRISIHAVSNTVGMAHKVLFLDVDGVLHAADAKHRPFRQPCMDVLRTILQDSSCHVCLSSNWRLDSWGVDKINARLEQIGADAIIDTTHLVEDHFNTRADEILDWLHRHPETTHFVVLDDVDLCYEDPAVTMPECISAHFVLTDEHKGLQVDDARRALACLEIPFDRAKLVPARLLEEAEAEAAAAEEASFDALEVRSTPATAHALEAHAVPACPASEREGCDAATAARYSAPAEAPTLVPLTPVEQQLAEALVSNVIRGAHKSNASSHAGSRVDSRIGSRRISRRVSRSNIDIFVRDLD